METPPETSRKVIGFGAPSRETTRPPRGASETGVISRTLLPLVGVQT